MAPVKIGGPALNDNGGDFVPGRYLKKGYSEKDYIEQFSVRIPNLLNKLDRMEAMYKKEKDVPEFFWDVLKKQRFALNKILEEYNIEVVSPLKL